MCALQALLWGIPILVMAMLSVSAFFSGQIVELFFQGMVLCMILARVVSVRHYDAPSFGVSFSVTKSLFLNLCGRNVQFFMYAEPRGHQTVTVEMVSGVVRITVHEMLWEAFTDEELRMVFAHEMGHVRSHDFGLYHLRSLLISMLFFVIAHAIMTVESLGSLLLWLTFFWFFCIPWILVSMFVQDMLCEVRADALASLAVGFPEKLISALLKTELINAPFFKESTTEVRVRLHLLEYYHLCG
jgi:Zn-dependent protease with chaperone function